MNEIWMSVFGGFVLFLYVCMAAAIRMASTQGEGRQRRGKGERGRARRNERAHDRF